MRRCTHDFLIGGRCCCCCCCCNRGRVRGRGGRRGAVVPRQSTSFVTAGAWWLIHVKQRGRGGKESADLAAAGKISDVHACYAGRDAAAVVRIVAANGEKEERKSGVGRPWARYTPPKHDYFSHVFLADFSKKKKKSQSQTKTSKQYRNERIYAMSQNFTSISGERKKKKKKKNPQNYVNPPAEFLCCDLFIIAEKREKKKKTGLFVL